MKVHDPGDPQHFYARVLDWAAGLGFVLLTLSFALYLAGPLAPLVPLEELPRYWGLSAPRYRLALGVEAGWSWFARLQYGDFLTFLPLSFLAGAAILAYLALLPRFWRRRELLLGGLAVLQVLVLLLAASGILNVGGH
ncbi:MAG: hypothetical protein FJ128_07480 [Deltaproteobacteria bacterium]|nr:hypothetical protein [Deltaproteobacteria bacterium]